MNQQTVIYNDLFSGEQVLFMAMKNEGKNTHYRKAEKEAETCFYCAYRIRSDECRKIGKNRQHREAIKIKHSFTCDLWTQHKTFKKLAEP